jgi:orotidine-5'-phosphate decarboxylase
MKYKLLENNIKSKNSFLCLGLDTDINKIPKHFLSYDDPVFDFNKAMVDRLNEKVVAVKINTAFYEARGKDGWISLERTINYINKNYPDLFTIADAKRADIGNTSKMYAKAFFEKMQFDSITLSPYMGYDSVTEFLNYKDKNVILLSLTSNQGAKDFQLKNNLYLNVLSESQKWDNSDRIMYVVGATKSDYLTKIRQIAPESFLLIPGIGSQGGDFENVILNSTKKNNRILINISRAIIYASNDKDFLNSAEKVVDDYNNRTSLK